MLRNSPLKHIHHYLIETMFCSTLIVCVTSLHTIIFLSFHLLKSQVVWGSWLVIFTLLCFLIYLLKHRGKKRNTPVAWHRWSAHTFILKIRHFHSLQDNRCNTHLTGNDVDTHWAKTDKSYTCSLNVCIFILHTDHYYGSQVTADIWDDKETETQ